ncbi:MAG: TRAP transporter small permease [Deltaproteobacteria bacterium]|nr:TRAP transporter small permease [Deltaproteobacteria bacterium]
MLKKIIHKIDQYFIALETWSLLLAVCTALIVAMTNILLRKLTSDFNLYWSDEVVRKTIYFSTYIGCVVAVRQRSLIRIDALPQLVPGLKKYLTLFSHLATLLFAGIMVSLGWTMTVMMYEDAYARTASLRIPEWIFYAVLPTMGAMMFFRTLLVMVEDWKEGAVS